jgi:uncharacterized protein YbjT (DUF2867 family)
VNKILTMKYAITGAAGNISGLLAPQLLKAGHQVRVIGRVESHLSALAAAGAETVAGSLEDGEFLKSAFSGVDAVYTMYPFSFGIGDLNGFHEQLAGNYAAAIAANGVRYVLNLSSIGAHLPEGAGPVSALCRAEGILNGLKDVNIKHLRPAYFYQNLLGYVDMIRSMQAIGNNFSLAAAQFPLASFSDIADAAAEELLRLDFSTHTVRYIASDETSTDEIAGVIGRSIGIPALKWIRLSDEQLLYSLLQQGFPGNLAVAYVEMGRATASGLLLEDYRLHRPQRFGKVKLEDFAQIFTTYA